MLASDTNGVPAYHEAKDVMQAALLMEIVLMTCSVTALRMGRTGAPTIAIQLSALALLEPSIIDLNATAHTVLDAVFPQTRSVMSRSRHGACSRHATRVCATLRA